MECKQLSISDCKSILRTESLQASSSIITQEQTYYFNDNTEFSNIDGFANHDFNVEDTDWKALRDHNFFIVNQMVMSLVYQLIDIMIGLTFSLLT